MDCKVTIGDDFEIRLRLENTSMEVRTTKVAMTAKTAFYTGISAKDLNDTVEEVELAGGEGDKFRINYKNYFDCYILLKEL